MLLLRNVMGLECITTVVCDILGVYCQVFIYRFYHRIDETKLQNYIDLIYSVVVIYGPVSTRIHSNIITPRVVLILRLTNRFTEK